MTITRQEIISIIIALIVFFALTLLFSYTAPSNTLAAVSTNGKVMYLHLDEIRIQNMSSWQSYMGFVVTTTLYPTRHILFFALPVDEPTVITPTAIMYNGTTQGVYIQDDGIVIPAVHQFVLNGSVYTISYYHGLTSWKYFTLILFVSFIYAIITYVTVSKWMKNRFLNKKQHQTLQ